MTFNNNSINNELISNNLSIDKNYIDIIINDCRGYFKLNKWTRDKLIKENINIENLNDLRVNNYLVDLLIHNKEKVNPYFSVKKIPIEMYLNNFYKIEETNDKEKLILNYEAYESFLNLKTNINKYLKGLKDVIFNDIVSDKDKIFLLKSIFNDLSKKELINNEE